MKTRWFFGAILVIAITTAVWGCNEKAKEAATATGEGIAWMEFDDGMAKARETGKPVMVDFYTTWCKYCKLLEDTTYKDPEIISLLNTNFICIKVDAEGTDKVTDKGKEMTKADLAKSYNVQGYPTIWFFKSDGSPIGPIPGYSAPEEFKPVLTFITSGEYAKGVKYQDYLNSLKGKGDAGQQESGK